VPPADAAELDRVIEQFRRAQQALLNGDAGPVMSMFSRRDDVTLSNPLGPTCRGWNEVEEATKRVAASFRGGGGVTYEEVSRYVTPGLAYLVQREHADTKVAGRDESSRISLRVTLIFRREDDSWKIVHRHADQITTLRPVEALIQG
jgi:ketosteroid isomerase-like protein